MQKKPSRLSSIMGEATWYLFEILWIMLQYSIQALCSIDWANIEQRLSFLWQKIGNDLKL